MADFDGVFPGTSYVYRLCIQCECVLCVLLDGVRPYQSRNFNHSSCNDGCFFRVRYLLHFINHFFEAINVTIWYNDRSSYFFVKSSEEPFSMYFRIKLYFFPLGMRLCWWTIWVLGDTFHQGVFCLLRLLWNTAVGFGRSELLRAYSKFSVIKSIEIVKCWLFSTISLGFWHINI